MRKTVILLNASFWIYVIGNSFFENWIWQNIIQDQKLHVEIYPYLKLSYPLFFYLSYFFALNALRNKKIWIYVSIGIACLILGIPSLFGAKVIYYGPFILLSILPPLFMGGLFRFFIDWLHKDKQQMQLAKQNLQSELALLRNQLNPHFLFNSLNNIDSLISTNPQKASDSLLKLSDMMRYMLYETNSEKVSIRQEAESLQKYVALQRLRLTEEDSVSFRLEIGNGELPIAPMLFIPFVENAFKHTTGKNVKNGISIFIKTSGNDVYFEITNIFDKKKHLTKDATPGIGLANVKRRLELLYPKHHDIKINEENDLYHVKLTINTDAD